MPTDYEVGKTCFVAIFCYSEAQGDFCLPFSFDEMSSFDGYFCAWLFFCCANVVRRVIKLQLGIAICFDLDSASLKNVCMRPVVVEVLFWWWWLADGWRWRGGGAAFVEEEDLHNTHFPVLLCQDLCFLFLPACS